MKRERSIEEIISIVKVNVGKEVKCSMGQIGRKVIAGYRQGNINGNFGILIGFPDSCTAGWGCPIASDVILFKCKSYWWVEPKVLLNENPYLDCDVQNKPLNLVEILKDVPLGTKLYCPAYGEVALEEIDYCADYPIMFTFGFDKDTYSESVTKEGKFYEGYKDGECMLFPSKENRDWSKFVPPLKDLEIDTPIFLSHDGEQWLFRCYAGKGRYFGDGKTSKSKGLFTLGICEFSYVVLAKDFCFDNPTCNTAKSIKASLPCG